MVFSTSDFSPASNMSEFETTETNESINSSDAGVGLANPKLDSIRRNTLDLVNKLHNTGVQVDIDLPQIAVVGQQSAGKSSLIESISGITLPRAAGTCTRCPTECRLSQSKSPWQCTVSLRFTTDPNGQPLGQARNEIFGPVIMRKSEVEEQIRRAQRAILNPSLPAKQFLDCDDEDIKESQLSFSSNCVCLQISGADVADLSFCDLPGIIASVRTGGNTGDIQLVENLIQSYIKKPSCIILLTVACETDFENQGAHRLTKQFDPEGKRTIGVLTKPDRIQSGEEGNWIAFIKHEKELLENNWFCVKQPSSTELKAGLTWQDARKNEDNFFLSTTPWSELEGIYQQFLRTRNLVERLSTVLSDLVLKRLPEIQRELREAVTKTEKNLRELPKEPSKEPFSEIMDLFYKFCIDVSRHSDGVPEPDGLHQSIRPLQDDFRKAIQGTIPRFSPFSRSSEEEIRRPSFLETEEANEESDDRARFTYYIDEVMQKIQEARTRELPGYSPFSVLLEYIKATTGHWEGPALEFCREVHIVLAGRIRRLIQLHFSSFGQGSLEQRVHMLLQDHLQKCSDNAEDHLRWLIRTELDPSTLNTYHLASYSDKFLAHYRGERAKKYHTDLMDAISKYQAGVSYKGAPFGLQKVFQGLSELSITGIKPEDIPNVLPSDPLESALRIMADVRAYTQVAYKRFVDNVPNAVNVELIRGVDKGLLQVLTAGIGIYGPNGMATCNLKELAKENPTVAHKRAELRMKLERLTTASSELLSLGRAG
ncbi:hypothetical protein AMATHDRAFT_60959 [Amanita thiersii Skay4041]|uniref:GED domain-containing protein n=1 Tax=Amanita thiersii Skay4041 TaxID=703135 RepID=A0A2A9NM87_9AGAR|nr:hypothetical protein AMATHDRAFT_60959 [Amanita thiersii Skay4041]